MRLRHGHVYGPRGSSDASLWRGCQTSTLSSCTVSLQVTMVLSEHTRYSGAMQYLLNVTSAIASGPEGEPTFGVNGSDGMS